MLRYSTVAPDSMPEIAVLHKGAQDNPSLGGSLDNWEWWQGGMKKGAQTALMDVEWLNEVTVTEG